MSSTAKPSCALQGQDLGQDLAGEDHVEGGRGLVQDEQPRPQGEGHGDHGPLAHASRQLVGVAFGGGPGQADLVAQVGGAGRAAGRAIGSWARMASAIWRVTVSSGFKRVHAALGDQAGLPPAHRAQLSIRTGPADRARRSSTRPPAITAGGSSSRSRACARVDLPLPDSPTRPKTSPAAIRNETPSTARTRPESSR